MLQLLRDVADEVINPRFRDLSVELLTGADTLDRTLRFRVHAVLQADASSEAVIYDTLVDPVSGGLMLVGSTA